MKRQSPKSAPFMYENGTIADFDKCIDTVENSLKHNTFAIGFIGIAEMCQAFTDYDMCDKEFKTQVILYLEEMRK